MCLQYKGHRELFLLFEDLLWDSLSLVLIILRNAVLAFDFGFIALLQIGYECTTLTSLHLLCETVYLFNYENTYWRT